MLTEDFEKNMPQARVTHSGLVLSFPNAVTPVLWRGCLDKMDDTSFQLLIEGKLSILALKSSTGHLKEVARFSSHEEGSKAFQLATDALLYGGDSYAPISASGQGISFWGNVVAFILLLLLIGGGIFYYVQQTQDKPDATAVITKIEQPTQQKQVVQTQSEPQQKPEFKPGVAVDVDRLFGK